MSNEYFINESARGRKGYCCKDRNEKDDYVCHSKIDCRPDKIIFKCRDIAGGIVTATAPGTPVRPTTIGNISVSDLCCFKKPCVKLDISMIATITTAVAAGTAITVRVFKSCDNSDEVEIKTFSLGTPVVIPVGTNLPISLSLCDCNNICDGDNCCRYRVEVEAVGTTGAFSVGQGIIALTAGDEY